MTPEKAKTLVLEHINSNLEDPDETRSIMDSKTIEKPYGWIFFYNATKYIETNDILYALGGNGPIVLLSADNSLHRLGSALPPEDEIRAFEKENGLSQ